MAKLLAIEWDASEARVAVGQRRGKDIVLDDAFSIQLTGAGDNDAVGAGEQIAAALAARNLGKSETLVAVGRASIELRQMTLPQAPDEELPELVRFQAQRQFTAISPDWPLDFVPLQSEGESTRVLAAAISPDLVTQIRSTCQASDLVPKRLVLRPFAAASLLCRHDRQAQQPPRLMIDILADEADLTVLDDSRVVLMRTVRLPSRGVEDATAALKTALLGETRRTIAAAQNQMQGKRIEKVVLCGDGSDQSEVKQHIEQELSYVVELFDPFEQLPQRGRQNRPEHAGRFTPLIGMLADEAAGAAHALDFLHPRKKPEPPSQRRRNTLVTATTAAAVAALGAFLWMEIASRNQEIKSLTAESNSLKTDVKRAEGHRADLNMLQAFVDNDFVWLDELHDLCVGLPPAEDVLLSRISLRNRAQGGGAVEVVGNTRESQQNADVREALRLNDREVASDATHQESRRTDYVWQFKHTAHFPPQGER